jgi:hypothetical protein
LQLLPGWEIRHLADNLTTILDWYHAVDHLGDWAKLWHRGDEESQALRQQQARGVLYAPTIRAAAKKAATSAGGPTEAGCKIIGDRLKGSGIRWVEDGVATW